MTDTANQQALDAALAQIDRAFGKDASKPAWHPERVNMRVWLDPFTVEVMERFIVGKIHDHVDEENFDEKLLEWLLDDIGDSIERGDHRVLEYYPFDRMYPPVSFRERVRLFVHRLLAGFR